MKLIDLLVRELPKRGGWPECAAKAEVFTYERGIVNFWTEEGKPFNGGANNFRMKGLSLCEVESVTRAKYEAALSASQKPAWNGEGLPPVGCECEFVSGELPTASDDYKPHDGKVIKIVSHEKYEKTGNEVVVAVWTNENNGMRASVFSPRCLRPLRTEADKKRDAAIKQIIEDIGLAQDDVAEAIYDAGYRKVVE